MEFNTVKNFDNLLMSHFDVDKPDLWIFPTIAFSYNVLSTMEKIVSLFLSFFISFGKIIIRINRNESFNEKLNTYVRKCIKYRRNLNDSSSSKDE